MMGNCRDCRFWGRDRNPMDDMPAWATVADGICSLTMTVSLRPVHQDSLAVVWEDDQSRGVLVTRADFGCVQFQPKDGA